ncbi:hypothetical protein MAR_006250, partial [Mya arenaria]
GDTSWDLQKQQQEDPDIKTAMGWVVNDNRPANKEIASGSYCLKSLWNQFDSLAIDDGILLKERLEVAHEMVRQNTGASIQRQKQIHDRNISYETFSVGDQVYVYFPVKKVGTSSKFTSFWKGPYTVLTKMSVVLYEINCGRKGKGQVIHCDRIRKSKSQALDRENDNVEVHNEVRNDQMVESDNIDDEHDVDLNTDDSFD